MQRYGKLEETHKELIKWMVGKLRKEGHDITHADHPDLEYPAPEKIKNHKPDIVSHFKGVRHVTEAETCGSIDDEHTESQWKEFDKAAGEFLVVVPNSCRVNAEERARKLGIRPKIY